ncbi:MAG: hypothetical protein DRO05_00750 [Thermoproteota archaeon]|nr:MAG: hypothetical protein DRO05_00750 [Candidatus Korarchaeota archaeon]
MGWKEIAVLLLFFLILACVGALTLIILKNFFPIILVGILALFVVIAVASFLLAVVGTFLTALGSIYYAVRKKPEVVPSPMRLEEAREPEEKPEER